MNDDNDDWSEESAAALAQLVPGAATKTVDERGASPAEIPKQSGLGGDKLAVLRDQLCELHPSLAVAPHGGRRLSLTSSNGDTIRLELRLTGEVRSTISVSATSLAPLLAFIGRTWTKLTIGTDSNGNAGIMRTWSANEAPKAIAVGIISDLQLLDDATNE
jgi:hypothetical protein